MAMPYTCPYELTDQIPTLNWEKRSDWFDVTSDQKKPAITNDNLDDTSAIQKALDQVGPRPGDIKVIYFPPGIYHLNKTLTLSERAGVMLVGHGKETVFVWKGKSNGRMFWSNGIHRSVFKGIVWDGENIAAVGIDHQSKTRYETHILHQDSEFKNFRLAGIRIGHNQKIATAEVFYRNLSFRNNRYGVLISSWNNYNNIFDGIHFYNNDIAISAEKGNFVVRNTLFENSKETDLVASTHSHSIRRAVSKHSNTFLRTVKGPAVLGNITLDNVLVSDWKNDKGAVFSSLRGPLIAFDTHFKNTNHNSSAIVLDNNTRMKQTAVLSNVLMNDSADVLKSSEGNSVTLLKSSRARPLVDIDSLFLKHKIEKTQTIFDAKKDCDAKGDGKNNDTNAIKKCIRLASENDDFSEIYFPSGIYRITSGLNISTKNILLRGSGFHSILYWEGKPAEKLLSLNGADDVSIEDISLESRNDDVKLFYSGTQTGITRLNNVYGYYRDQNKTTQAFEFSGTNKDAIVLADVLIGPTRFSQNGQVNVLVGSSSSLFMEVNSGLNENGFIGISSRVSCCSDTPLTSKNNSSFIISDWYNEQSKHLFEVEGELGEKSGKITMSFSKAETESADIMKIHNYTGTLNLSGGFFGRVQDKESHFRMNVLSQNVTLNIIGTMFRYKQPLICNQGMKQCSLLGNIIDGGSSAREVINDRYTEKEMESLVSSFEDFRKLGQRDLKYNYCHVH